MGQNTSSQREREGSLRRDSRRFTQLVQDRESGNTQQARARLSVHGRMDQSSSLRSTGSPQQQDPHSTRPLATISRQISARFVPVRGSLSNSGDALTRDQIFYEQQEERPLVHMEDLGMRNAPITHITASPMPRRSSVISRLSSRFLPRYSTIGSPDTDHEGYGEGRTLRRRLSDRLPPGSTDDAGQRSNHRFSMFGSLGPGSLSSRTRRRRELTPISRPIPMVLDGSLSSDGYTITSAQSPSPEETPPPRRNLPSTLSPPNARTSRLSRVRRSLSLPIGSLLSTSREQAPQDHIHETPPRRPTTVVVADSSEYLLPPLAATDPSIDLDNSELESLLSNNRDSRTHGFPTVLESPERPPARAERQAERGPGGRREARRMPNMLRGRSSRLIRRDDEGPLPGILRLAAVAIAAQLSGNQDQTITNMQAVGADGLDGSLNNLFRTLQHATTSTADGRPVESGNDLARPPGTPPPLNFLRVFRFVNSAPGSGANSMASATDRLNPRTRADERPSLADDPLDGSDGRTVTLVIVGVRSVPSDHAVHEDAGNADPSLDALLNLPVAPSSNPLRGGGGGLLRHADGRSRFAHRRRASMGGVNTFPANYDSQRHQRMLNSSRQDPVEPTTLSSSAIQPTVISESPPGPHPPPSTPAEPGLSAFSSGTTTPNRRPSSASAAQHLPVPSHDVAAQHLREAGILTPEDQATPSVQQRRRSDSEFARHRDLGAGAARRNGVVEPDDVDHDDTPSQGSRSWLIYVVGTNLSEDHPAFAAPSLFTDVSAFTSISRYA